MTKSGGTSEMNKNFKKFVWEYIILNGVACVPGRWNKEEPEWSTYSCDYVPVPDINRYDFKSIEKWRKDFIVKLKEVGVDWENTKEPKGSTNSEFNGTFAENTDVECLYGTLYLNNGEKFLMGCKSECGFETYAKFFSMLENYNKSGDIFKKES